MQFSVLIPTYNRPADLMGCIDSIVTQEPQPKQCVIIDDGELTQAELALIRGRLGSIALTYYKKDHSKEKRGQSTSKNIGLALASEDVVFIFDDDVVLEGNYFSSIMKVWQSRDNERLMGVGGFIENLRAKTRLEKLYNAVFLLTSRTAWDVTPVGFQVWDDQMSALQKAYYMHGGLCSVRKSRAVQFPFVVFKDGRAFLEDVDFCLRAKNAGYHFYMEPKARARHNTSPASRDSLFLAGVKETMNRGQIFRSNAVPTMWYRLWYAWSTFGWILRQFMAGNIVKGAGMVAGLMKN